MSDTATADTLFFDRTGLNRKQVEGLVANALHGADDGELYLEYTQSESLVFDDSQLKSATFDESQGFGLRSLAGEATGYAHASDLSEEAIKRAAMTVRAVHVGHGGSLDVGPRSTSQARYAEINPLREMPFEKKVRLLEDINEYARSKDDRIRQVSASIFGKWQAVLIVRGDGQRSSDIRPLVRLNVSIVVEKDGRMESGSAGAGGRAAYDGWVAPSVWQGQVDEALRQALTNLESVPAPAGEMPVVLGPGWTGVLLHEAVGHGLEGDFNRKETSTFSGRIGEQVAARNVTVVDDGTVPDRRGSLTIDDEGTPTSRTVLIEDGILKGYMQDRLNARLMGVTPTGNGRRESYAHHPMPRMTNTFMLAGKDAPEDILKSVDKGLYCVNFGGGQVDITSGKFTFSCTEAYKIEKGKVGPPVKGATLIGNGPEVMNRISMVGDDLKLDTGIGTCGKNGQGVPVGVGQPSVRVDGITVGGTEAA